MTYKCPLCSRDLESYGTGYLTCEKGHQFLEADVHGRQGVAVRAGSRRAAVPAWVPGAVLGGLALIVSILEAVGVL